MLKGAEGASSSMPFRKEQRLIRQDLVEWGDSARLRLTSMGRGFLCEVRRAGTRGFRVPIAEVVVMLGSRLWQ